jgi:hypothetical protein
MGETLIAASQQAGPVTTMCRRLNASELHVRHQDAA